MPKKYELSPWSLEELFTSIDGEDVDKAMEQLDKEVLAFESYREKLGEDIDPDEFLKIIDHYDGIVRLASRLVGFSHLNFTEDTQDQNAQVFLGKMQQITAELQNRILFFNLWWKGLEDGPALKLMEATGDYSYWLEALRLQKPYTLSEPEEKIINIKDVNGPQAIVNLYTSMTNRYTFKLEVDGEELELTRGELGLYVRDSDPDLREAAYKELNRVFAQDAPILGQMYQYRARDWRSENLDLRGHSTPIGVRNLTNNVPDEVVDALLETCRSNASLFHRFFELKARWLGMEKLRRYDIYAPVAKSDQTYSFGEAVEMTLESFNQFDPRFAQAAQKILDENHLDSEVRKGKRSGAFCSTLTPDLTPWVLTSFKGIPDDVATLAHELGHGVHSLLSRHHRALTHSPSLPMAETASTFGEMLLIDHLLDENSDPAVQRDVLFRQVDDSYATIMRQAYFSMFERTAHEKIKQGASVDELSNVYLENLQDQFADSLDLSEDFKVEWVAIPHFYHTPFYVYAYAFGKLLVLSLYKQYHQEGESFKPRYIEILAAGGSDAPVRILENAGVDVRSADFWQGGFDVIEEQIKQLEGIEIPELEANRAIKKRV
jgi:oligoendopeptidase F